MHPQEIGRIPIPLGRFGFAGLCLMLSVKALSLEEAASTAGPCQQGSECSRKNTMPSGSFVQSHTNGSKSNVIEKDVDELGESYRRKTHNKDNV